MAARLSEAWRCPAAGHRPPESADELPDTVALPLRRCAAQARKVMGLSETPRTCPWATLYGPAPPLAVRATQGLALLDKGLPERVAFPGGATAADRQAVLVLNAALAARHHSDDLDREREAARKRAEAEARQNTR